MHQTERHPERSEEHGVPSKQPKARTESRFPAYPLPDTHLLVSRGQADPADDFSEARPADRAYSVWDLCSIHNTLVERTVVDKNSPAPVLPLDR